MSYRYIFNTSGRYVAFASADHVFLPDGSWAGFIRDGHVVYDTNGNHLGFLTDDDRIVTRPYHSEPSVFAPFPPLPPLPPLRPLDRLRMPSLPAGYQDVFGDDSFDFGGDKLSELNTLLNSELVANDGTFLGKVTKNRFEQDSLRNQFGPYGNRYSAQSIFNPYSPYGNQYSPQSAFNEYSTTPPQFIKQKRLLAYLTRNKYLSPAVRPEQFQAWLSQL